MTDSIMLEASKSPITCCQEKSECQKVVDLLRQTIGLLEKGTEKAAAPKQEYSPRPHFWQCLQRFQGKPKFDIRLLCDIPMSGEQEEKVESRLLTELHNIIVREHKVWSPYEITQVMVRQALTVLHKRQQDLVYPKGDPFATFNFHMTKCVHSVTVWSKLTGRGKPFFTDVSERFIMSTYDLIQEEATKQGYEFFLSYVLFKICQTLNIQQWDMTYFAGIDKSMWYQQEGNMAHVFATLKRQWLPLPSSK